MLSEANGDNKTFTVNAEQFAQVLTKATNLWLYASFVISYYHIALRDWLLRMNKMHMLFWYIEVGINCINEEALINILI